MKPTQTTANYDRYLCPFHKDTDPSLVIAKQGPFAGIYHCFGCGAHGQAKDLGIVISAKPEPRKKWDWTVYQKVAVRNDYWTEIHRQELAKEWGINEQILYQLGYGWCDNAHTFPMYNENDTIIGIQRRLGSRKLCVEGSQLGLFVPDIRFYHWNSLLITEGVSDCAAVLDLGFAAIGRPSAQVGETLILKWLYKRWHKFVLIVADNDASGLKGANDIYNTITDAGWKCEVFVPFAKDLRELIQKEGKSKVKEGINERLAP